MSESDTESSSSLPPPDASEEHPPFWDADNVPLEDDEEFAKRIGSYPKSLGSRPPPFKPKDTELSSWLSAPNSDSYISFGADGVTASVNAYGDLIQFGAHFDAGVSGMFCVDHRTTDEPYFVCGRMGCLLNLSKDQQRASTTYGLNIPGLDLTRRSFAGYVHNRWPRYRFDDDNLDVSVQWMVHDGVVLQQYLIENKGPVEQQIPIKFANMMHIRDLEYILGHNHFNDEWKGHLNQRAPNGYGWVLVHPLESDFDNSVTQQEQESRRASTEKSFTLYPKDQTPSEIPNGDDESEKPQNLDIDAVSIIVSIFVDGKAVKWDRSPSGNSLDELELLVKDLGCGDAMEIVVAYKMAYLPEYTSNKQDWNTFLVLQGAANVNQFLEDESATWKQFGFSQTNEGTLEIRDSSTAENPKGVPKGKVSPSKHINFVLHRTLEHILSVCAIPVANRHTNEDCGIALTCGDMSGHRISISASFFAFSFLIQVLKLLNHGPCKDDNSFDFLRRRIQNTCQGHLKWLSKADKKSECFAANYWVTGKIISSNNSSSFTPSDSFTDSAFQIIKAAEFAKVSNTEIDRDILRQIVFNVAKSWIETLNRSDKRDARAWPRAQVEGYNKYRLSDHFWIWRALRLFQDLRHTFDPKSTKRENKTVIADSSTAKNLNMQPSDGKRSEENVEENKKENEKELFRKFAAGDVQRDILRRFTAENDVSKKRMLAMTRSPRETRYLFHAGDTALFHGVEFDFFLQETSFNEVWENTLEAQIHHSENSETGWENLIRYALSVMIGSRGKRINKRLPRDLVTSSLNILFGASSQHGLFHGQIDGTTKEPAIFTMEEDRDFFFHATLEIPFILLTHSAKIHSILDDEQLTQDSSSGPDPSPKGRDTHNPVQEVAEILTIQPKYQSPTLDLDLKMTEIATENIINNQGHSVGVQSVIKSKPSQAVSMKKTMPFNSLIDQTSIVEIKEEWLYNYPIFLQMETDLNDQDLGDELRRTSQIAGETPSAVIAVAAQDFLKRTKDEPTEARLDQNRTISWIADVPKRSQNNKRERKKRDVTPSWYHGSRDLWSKLKVARKAKEAKKRVVWLPCASDQTAMVCSVASQGDEMLAMSLFFDRHFHYENFFFDDSTMATNEWETELHLSFYQLVSVDDVPPIPGIPAPTEAPPLPNVGMKLVRGSIGFRFVGDFFDRYWTCHIVEHIPTKMANLSLEHDERFDPDKVLTQFTPPWGNAGDLVTDQRCWRQRKVLELHLFHNMLKELVASTKDVYMTVRKKLGISHSGFLFSVLNSDDYFKSSAQWQKYQQILQVVDEELSDVFLTISKWDTRQKDRGQERPRWTRDDERKYRQYIRKLEGLNRHRIRDLHKYYTSIRSLKETLKTSQEQITNDLGLRGSENIRFFTYVTVVFLPLGFAASVFSLSDEPPGEVLIPMVICAVVALVLTATALVNAKRLNAGVGKFSEVVDGYSKEKIEQSLLFPSDDKDGEQGRKRREVKQVDAERAPESKPHRKDKTRSDRRRETREGSASWHIAFWLAYLFVELPARRIAAAFQAAQKPKLTSWRTYINLVLGVLLLPVFIVSLICQIALYNIFDVARAAWEYLEKNVKFGDWNDGEDFLTQHQEWLTYPLYRFRPLNNQEQTDFKKGVDRVDSSQSKIEND